MTSRASGVSRAYRARTMSSSAVRPSRTTSSTQGPHRAGQDQVAAFDLFGDHGLQQGGAAADQLVHLAGQGASRPGGPSAACSTSRVSSSVRLASRTSASCPEVMSQ